MILPPYCYCPSNKQQVPKKYCIDHAPCNPDKRLIQCDKCDKWLHGTCLEKACLRHIYNTNGLELPEPSVSKKGRPSKKNPEPSFTAALTPNDNDNTRLVMKITDNRPGRGNPHTTVPINCLSCKARLDPRLDEATLEDAAAADEETEDASVEGIQAPGPEPIGLPQPSTASSDPSESSAASLQEASVAVRTEVRQSEWVPRTADDLKAVTPKANARALQDATQNITATTQVVEKRTVVVEKTHTPSRWVPRLSDGFGLFARKE